MKKKVSIIIPVYNAEKYLTECIESVLNQKMQEIELIMIDDGSKDQSACIMKKYMCKYPDIIKCIFQKNQGQSAARNRGLEMAKGSYIVFVDSDDYIGPNYIKSLFEAADRYESDMVLCDYTKVDEEGNILREYKANYEEKGVRIPSYISCNRIIKHELFHKYGIRYKEGVICEDIPAMLELEAIAQNIHVISMAEYYYRTNPNSTTSTLKKRNIKMNQLPFRALEECLEFYENNKKDPYDKKMEFFLCRIWTSLLFEVGRGASKNVRKNMCHEIEQFMDKYYPDYYKNPYVKLNYFKNMAKIQKWGTWAFVRAMHSHLLYPLTTICRWI